MRNLDPRSKICLLITVFTTAVLFREIYFLLGLLWFSLMLCIFAGAELGKMFRKMKWITVLIFLSSIAVCVFNPRGEIYFEYNEIVLISKHGMQEAIKFILQSYIFLVLSCFVATSTQRETIQALIAAKVPYELALFFTFPGRYLPILSDEYNSSLRILIMKGINIHSLPFLQKINMYTYIWSSSTTNAWLKSKELSISMESRGFRLIDEQENVYKSELRIPDYFIIFWSIMALTGIVLWKIL